MNNNASVTDLLHALEASIFSLELHARHSLQDCSVRFLPKRRRAHAMLKAALRYRGVDTENHRVNFAADEEPSQTQLWQQERRVVHLYRELIMHTPIDAVESRLLREQCRAAEQYLARLTEQVGDWRGHDAPTPQPARQEASQH